MKRTAKAIAALCALVLIAGIPALAKTFPLTATQTVPAAAGKAEVKRDKNGNTDVEISTEHLAQPGMLTPPATRYVVWFQEQGSNPTNAGQLRIDKDLKGTFKTTTRFQNFDVFITAESDPMAKSPAGQTVLETKVQVD